MEVFAQFSEAPAGVAPVYFTAVALGSDPAGVSQRCPECPV